MTNKDISAKHDRLIVNNSYYDELKDRWYTAQNNPIALLRAESRLHSHWIIHEIQNSPTLKNKHPKDIKILDIGCGAGFVSNALAKHSYSVTGLDSSLESLEVAKTHDVTESVEYTYGDAYKLPFDSQTFNVVVALDFLEHVSQPESVIAEVSRVLKPKGLFFFHTFNQTFWSWLIIIKCVEWFIPNTPPNMHVYHLFIPLEKLTQMCITNDLTLVNVVGSTPCITPHFLASLLFKRKISENLEFKFTKNTKLSYCGIAVKAAISN